MSPTTRHRCDVSSELCSPGAKPRRWAPQLVTRFGVLRRVYWRLVTIVATSVHNHHLYVWSSRALEGGGWSPPYIFFSFPPKNFEPPFRPLFQKFITTIHPMALQRWLMATLVIRFFSWLIPSNQRTNFCNFVTKVNKIAKTVKFRGNFEYKALRNLFKMSQLNFLQLKKKQQRSIKLELQPRVETWLLGVGVSVSVSVCWNPYVRFQFWFGFTTVEK